MKLFNKPDIARKQHIAFAHTPKTTPRRDGLERLVIVTRSVLCASLIVFAWRGAFAQPSTFEVASVKLSPTGIRGNSMEFSKGGDRFTATNTPVGALILVAYDVTVRQLSVLDPALSDRYDIAAKSDRPVRADEMRRMLQALLRDRFHLVVHRETREVPVYALIVAKNGPKLQRSKAPENEAAMPRTPARAGGAEPASGHLIFRNESMSDFAWALSRMAGIGDRVVVDSTGLRGNYDFELTFERYRAPASDVDGQKAEVRPEGSSLFSSLQEQLGLKLESRKAPVEFLVIDHVEKPTQN